MACELMGVSVKHPRGACSGGVNSTPFSNKNCPCFTCKSTNKRKTANISVIEENGKYHTVKFSSVHLHLTYMLFHFGEQVYSLG